MPKMLGYVIAALVVAYTLGMATVAFLHRQPEPPLVLICTPSLSRASMLCFQGQIDREDGGVFYDKGFDGFPGFEEVPMMGKGGIDG